MDLDSKMKVLGIYEVCEERRARDVVILDVTAVTLIADYFLICHGTSRTHIGAISERVVEHLKEHDDRSFRVEGSQGEGWILVDCGDVLVHIFTAEDREYYDLERLWGDAEVLTVASPASR